MRLLSSLALAALVATALGCDCGGSTVSREATFVIEPEGLQFGTVTVGDKVTKSVAMKNTGTVPVTVSALEIAAPYSTTVTPFELGSGETKDLDVTYAPTQPNAASDQNDVGQLAVLTDTESNPRALVSLVGHAVKPSFVVDPRALPFGDVLVGDTKSLDLTVKNEGSDKLEVTSVAIDPPGPFGGDTQALKGIYQPSTSRPATFTFTPATGGPQNATLILESTAGTVRVPLDGNGLMAQVKLCYAVQGQAEKCLDATDPAKRTGSVNFGALVEGAQSGAASITLKNEGNLQVPLFGGFTNNAFTRDATTHCGAQKPSDFTFTPGGFEPKLPADPTASNPNPPSSQSMTVTYTPTHSAGCREDISDSAQLSVKVGSGSKAPVLSLTIQGSSKLGAIGVDNFTFQSGAIDLPYQVRNTGSGPLQVSSVTLVKGYSASQSNQAFSCASACAGAAICAGATDQECKSFTFLAATRTSFTIAPGGQERVTTSATANDLHYEPPPTSPATVVACVRIESDDVIEPVKCAELIGRK